GQPIVRKGVIESRRNTLIADVGCAAEGAQLYSAALAESGWAIAFVLAEAITPEVVHLLAEVIVTTDIEEVRVEGFASRDGAIISHTRIRNIRQRNQLKDIERLLRNATGWNLVPIERRTPLAVGLVAGERIEDRVGIDAVFAEVARTRQRGRHAESRGASFL